MAFNKKSNQKNVFTIGSQEIGSIDLPCNSAGVPDYLDTFEHKEIIRRLKKDGINNARIFFAGKFTKVFNDVNELITCPEGQEGYSAKAIAQHEKHLRYKLNAYYVL